jgi:hypothetical protein
MTLDELRKVVEEADLMGFGDNVTPRIRGNWDGTLKEIEFDDDRVAVGEPVRSADPDARP